MDVPQFSKEQFGKLQLEATNFQNQFLAKRISKFSSEIIYSSNFITPCIFRKLFWQNISMVAKVHQIAGTRSESFKRIKLETQ